MTAPTGSVDGVLAGRYRLLERIAVGGMGEVWKGEDTVLGRPVAVKLLRPEYVDDAEFRERFRGEARHAAGLSHAGIASVFDYGEQAEPDTAAWLVMELVEGEPLSALLRRGRLDPPAALDVVGQAALALEAAHAAGVVHRDVKPGNLMVRPDGVVKVTDFGIARATDAVPLTRTGTMVGTAYYLSPEQAGGRAVTPASDVYSLGVVAYECLAGRRPFPGDNPVSVANAHLHEEPPPLPDEVPGPVRDWVLSALQKDPADRPAHAGEFGRTAMTLRAELESTDAPTRIGGPAETGGGHETRVLTAASRTPGSRLPPRPVRPPAAPHRNHRRAVRLTSALLAVVVLGLSLRACGGDERTTVPTVAAGASVADATSALTRAELEVGERRTEPSAAVPAGRVLRTDPAAGARVAAGRAVALVVSAGPRRVTVSESAYVGRDPAEVSSALTKLGLRPGLAYDGSGQRAGTVSSVTPSGAVPVGSVVTVRVVPVPVEREEREDERKEEDRGKGKGKGDD